MDACAFRQRSARAAATAVEATSSWLYRAPLWLPNQHVQTIVPALFARRPAVQFRRERWDTPDGDFIDLDWLVHDGQPARTRAPPRRRSRADAPLFVLFHGLEGSSDSHYARVLMAAAQERGWHGVVPHFRSCSGPLNLLPRFYHLADSNEVDWVLRRLRATHRGPIVAAGVSLGGNVLLRWLGERREERRLGDQRPPRRSPRRSTCMPAARRLSQGFGMVYTRSFLKTLKRKACRSSRSIPACSTATRCSPSRTHVRIRQRRDRAAARLSRHRRLLDAARPRGRCCRASRCRRSC